jgi:ABC-2 type transport system permease protein
MNALHIYGILLKNILLIKRSFPRLTGFFLWITFELFLWGFITFWLQDVAGDSAGVNFALLLVGALIFWDIFHRAAQSFSFAFLEDIWARNVINIFASPLSRSEMIMGFVLLSIVQATISFIYISLLAFVLYALNIWTLGLYAIPLFLNLLFFGWTIGLIIISILLRFGPSAEMFGFFIPFALLPFSAVYNPVSALPLFMQTIVQFVPPAHLFEGMRMIFLEGVFPASHLFWATGLNVVYFILALLLFGWMVKIARKRGFIARLVTD